MRSRLEMLLLCFSPPSPTPKARNLSQDPFGNYVVQYVLGLQDPQVCRDLRQEA